MRTLQSGIVRLPVASCAHASLRQDIAAARRERHDARTSTDTRVGVAKGYSSFVIRRASPWDQLVACIALCFVFGQARPSLQELASPSPCSTRSSLLTRSPVERVRQPSTAPYEYRGPFDWRFVGCQRCAWMELACTCWLSAVLVFVFLFCFLRPQTPCVAFQWPMWLLPSSSDASAHIDSRLATAGGHD